MALPPSDAAAPVATLQAPAATRIDAYGTLASAYVYRGIALRNRPTPEAALSVTLPSGWFTDVWTGPVDVNGDSEYAGELQRTWNVDAEAGYGGLLADTWQWSFATARIVAVGGGRDAPDAYTEWRANLYFGATAQGQLAYAPDYEQRGWSSWTIECAGTHPLTSEMSGEWGVGHTHGAGQRDADYSYGWLGLTAWWLRTQWEIRWIDAGHGAHYVLTDDRARSRLVVSLSWGVQLAP